jgi:archaellum component FlaG (FlaF/FlaG flagellin family)
MSALFLLVVGVGWLAAAIVVGLITGRAMRRADEICDRAIDADEINFDFQIKRAQADEGRSGAATTTP